MAPNKLPNHLRAHRKRLGLSQDEVAYLLGATSGAKTSRYERFSREPGFRTALACEALFQKPVRVLFAGLYEQIEREVAARARKLAIRSARAEHGKHTARKRQALERIASSITKKPLTR